MQSFTITTSTLIGPTDSLIMTDAAIFDFTVDQFDTSLGILDSVVFFYNVDFTLSGTTGSTTGMITGSVGGNLFAGAVNLESNGGGNGNGDGPDTAITAPFSTTNTSTILVEDAEQNFIDTVTGNGTFSLSYNVAATLDASGLGTDTGQLDITGGSVSWTYNFTTVPEPSSIVLLAFGAMAIFTRKRR